MIEWNDAFGNRHRIDVYPPGNDERERVAGMLGPEDMDDDQGEEETPIQAVDPAELAECVERLAKSS